MRREWVFRDMSHEFTSGYLREVTGDLDGPPCHVCGAIMVKNVPVMSGDVLAPDLWQCLSCGTTTGCS